MKLNAAAWIVLAALSVAFVAGASINHTRISRYCEKCGMRSIQQRVWMNFPIQNSTIVSDTNYSRIYKKVFAPVCAHQWQFTSSRSSGSLFHGGENGCGAYPYVLGFDVYYSRLDILSVAQSRAVLRALPLRYNGNHEPQRQILGALDDLDPNFTPSQTKAWWKKNQHLWNTKNALQVLAAHPQA